MKGPKVKIPSLDYTRLNRRCSPHLKGKTWSDPYFSNFGLTLRAYNSPPAFGGNQFGKFFSGLSQSACYCAAHFRSSFTNLIDCQCRQEVAPLV